MPKIYTETSIQNYKTVMPFIIAAANRILQENESEALESAILSFHNNINKANALLETPQLSEQKRHLRHMLNQLSEIPRGDYTEQSYMHFESELAPCLAMAIRILADEHDPKRVVERTKEFEKRKDRALNFLVENRE